MINALFVTSGNITGISAGSGFSLALLKNGSVTGWGSNNYGQLNVPTAISGQVTGITASELNNIALLQDGRITGWGFNQQSIPSDIQYNVSDFSAGISFNPVILKTDGKISGWGLDWGISQVTGLTGAKKISAGLFHNLILTSGNWVTGWGDNLSGQLNVPTGISGKVVEISAGAYHSLALLTGRVVTGWGSNSSGQLNVPISISGKVTGISAGGYHSVALLTGGMVTGWGDNTYGQLNFSTGISGKVVAISAGWDHNLILLNDGSAVAYGNNTFGAVNGITGGSSSSSSDIIYGDIPLDTCQTENLSDFRFNLKGEQNFTPPYNSKHKFIIYKNVETTGYTGYLPFTETNYNSYSQNTITTYTGLFSSGDYKSEVKTIYSDSTVMPSFCNAGVQVANLIDISYSNQSGLALFKSNSRILLDTLIRSNSGLNQVATIYFSDNIYTITGHNFTNNTGVFLNNIKTIEPYQKEKEGVAINDALDYAIQNLSWSGDKIKIVNIITNNFPYIESDADPCSINPFYAPPIEIKYSTFLNKIATYRDSNNVTFNFIYIDKELNYPINKSKFFYNEKDLKTFYAKAAQIGNGFFGDNDISIVGNSPLNASNRLSKLSFCPSIPLISTSSSLIPSNCCSTGTACEAGENLIIDYIKYVEGCGFCPNYVCSSGAQNNALTCGTNPAGLSENANVNLETYFVSYDLKDRLIVWLSGCNHRFNCNFINSGVYINNFVNNLNSSGLTLFDTTCIDTNGDLPPDSIPYNWEKFGNLFKATNNFSFKNGMFPLGICIVPNCNTSTTGTRYFASINGFVSGINFYIRSFTSGDSGICQQGNNL